MQMKLDQDHPDYPDLSAQDMLANHEDFRGKKGAMEDLVMSHGNIVLFSSKGHPEIAGAGVEFE